MATLVFVEHNGEEHVVEATPGDTIMEAAFAQMVPGILAECGGACACATCHIRVEPTQTELLPDIQRPEKVMLLGAIEPDEHSRLSCQIPITEEMHGLRILIPEHQV